MLLDLNELGPNSDYNRKRCTEIKRDSKSTDVGTVNIQMKNRHYIKAVGINTRNDQLSGSRREKIGGRVTSDYLDSGFNSVSVGILYLFRLCPPPPPSLVGAYYLHPQTHEPYFYIMIYYVMTRAL